MGIVKALVHFFLGILYGAVGVGALFLIAAVCTVDNDSERVDVYVVLIGLGPVLVLVLIGTIMIHLAADRWFQGH